MSDHLIKQALAAWTPETDNSDSAREVLATQAAFSAAIARYSPVGSNRTTAMLLTDGPAPELPQDLLNGAKLLTSRVHGLSLLPQGSIGVEVGTQTGSFAKMIIEIVKPLKIHLIDINFDIFDNTIVFMRGGTRVFTHLGISWEVLKNFNDGYFDWIYVDAGHDYASVKRDLAAANDKLRHGGVIMLNDYTPWSCLEGIRYGVMKAVNEFVLEMRGGYSVAWLALDLFGYHDIAIRKDW